ncbi:MAG: cytochrome c3 family protein [Thermodesulfovibrionales bacterium]
MKQIVFILMVMFFVSCAVLKGKTPEVTSTGTKAHADCNVCHKPHQMGGKILLNKPLSELCGSCHQTRIGAGEHKVGIKPSTPVDGLPLDADGKITCITCHDPHGAKGFASLLRERTFTDLCKKCHKGY